MHVETASRCIMTWSAMPSTPADEIASWLAKKVADVQIHVRLVDTARTSIVR